MHALAPAIAATVIGGLLGAGADAARAEPPRGQFGGGALAFGTSSQPTDCGFCARVFGPAVDVFAGWPVRDGLAVRGDLWLYLSGEGLPSLGLQGGAQLWYRPRASLRAELGVALFQTHDADGGEGVGPGATLGLTAGYRLWRTPSVTADLELRGTLLATPTIGLVSLVFAAYALRWE